MSPTFFGRILGALLLANFTLSGMTTAQAQGNPFEGFYAGALLGANIGDLEVDVNGIAFSSETDSDFSAGVFGGYNIFITPAILLGLESDITFSNLGGDFSLDNHKVSIVGRIGTLVTPNVLAFLAIGASGAQFKADITKTTQGMVVDMENELTYGEASCGPTLRLSCDYYNVQLPPVTQTTSREKRLWGFTIGVGVDAFIFGDILTGFEYRFTNFETWDFVALGDNFSVQEDLHEIRGRIAIPIN